MVQQLDGTILAMLAGCIFTVAILSWVDCVVGLVLHFRHAVQRGTDDDAATSKPSTLIILRRARFAVIPSAPLAVFLVIVALNLPPELSPAITVVWAVLICSFSVAITSLHPLVRLSGVLVLFAVTAVWLF